jgi:hypothetical protein
VMQDLQEAYASIPKATTSWTEDGTPTNLASTCKVWYVADDYTSRYWKPRKGAEFWTNKVSEATSPSINVAALNGHNTLSFNGVDQELQYGGLGDFSGNPTDKEFLIKIDEDDSRVSTYYLMLDGYASSYIIWNGAFKYVTMASTTAVNSGVYSGLRSSWVNFGFVLGTSGAFYTNNVLNSSVNSGSGSWGDWNIPLGSAKGSSFLKFTIAEYAFYASPLSSGDRTSLYNYWKTKYGQLP